MAKEHPVHKLDQSITMTQRAKDFVRSTVNAIRADVSDRAKWKQNKVRYFRRRYGLMWRSPTFPWPNSSNIVMPLIDMLIDKLKPAYTNLVFQAKPPVTVLSASGKEDQGRAKNLELLYEWIINRGSPNFKKEIVLAVDDLLETGRCITKTLWQYETNTCPESIEYERLPQDLAQLAVRLKGSGAQEMMMALSGTTMITEDQFKQNEVAIRQTIRLRFGLDREESVDKSAEDKIFAWLKGGAKEPLTFSKRDVKVDAPRLVAVSPHDVIVPASTTDIQDAERITHSMFMTDRMIRQRARDGLWNKGAVDELVKLRKNMRGKRSNIRRPFTSQDYSQDIVEQAIREGVDITDEDARFEIWEVCTWYDINNDGVDEKVVLLVSPDNEDAVLKFYAYQSPNGKWPYQTAEFELNKRRFYSPRGIPEKISDIDAETTFNHRAKANRNTIATAPTFAYRKGAGINPANWRWVPGQFYPTTNPQTDVVPIGIPNIDPVFDSEEDRLRTWASEYIGALDFGETFQRTPDRRTASEVQAMVNQKNQALALRGSIFQIMLQEIYDNFHDLWITHGPDNVWIQLTQDKEPIRLTKEDLKGDFIFVPTGTIGEVDPAVEAQKALARLQILMQIQAQGGTGDKYEIDIGEALRDYLEKEDMRAFRRIVRERSPQEIQQIQAQRQAEAERQQKLMFNEEMEPAEMEIALKEMQGKAPHGKAQRIKL